MRRRGRTLSYAGLLIVLLFLLLIEPTIPTSGLLNNLIWEGAFLFVVIAALASAQASRRVVVALVGAGLLGEILGVLSTALADDGLFRIASAFRILFLAASAGLTLRHLMTGRDVTADKILGAVCVYLLVGATFGFAFGMIGADGLDVPDRLQTYMGTVREDQSIYFYFSMTTITGLGYGDITPVAPLARSLATLEAAFGQLYLAIVIAALVGIRFAEGRGRPEG